MSDHELSMMRAQLQQDTKLQFSVFAISGYCDQPLQAVEKITFKYSNKTQSPMQQ